MRNEFEDYHDLPLYIPNPIKFLNFKLGFNYCMVMLVVTTIVMKVVACAGLKIFMKKF